MDISSDSPTTSHAITFVVIGVYFAVLIGVGLVFSRLVRNGDDYFKSGGQATWWLVGLSMFMGNISTYTFVGNAAGIFKSGWSPLAIYLGNAAAGILGALFIAAWYRQMRVVTVAEAIRARFGKTTEMVLATLMMINGMIWAGAILYGLSVFFTILVPGVSQTWLILAVGAVVIVYCTAGGSWAVMANDFGQGLIMVSVTILITVLCFNHAGGVGAFFAAVSESPAAADLRFYKPSAEGQDIMKIPYGLTWLVATFMVQFTASLSMFGSMRYFAAKDGREASKAAWLGAGLMLAGCIVFFIPPIFSRVYLFDEVMSMHVDPARAPEFSFAAVCQVLLPKGAFSLMIVSMLAAAISSLDTGLNRNSGLVVRHLLPGLLNALKLKPIAADREVYSGKMATVLLGVAIVALAVFYSQLKGVTLFDLMLNISNMLQVPLFVPLILFLFIRKVPTWSMLASISAGFLPSLANHLLGFGWSYQEQSLAIISASCTVFAGSALFYRSVPAEEQTKARTFYAQMEKPVDFQSEVGQSNDGFQLRQIGIIAVMMGGLILLLLLTENTPLGRKSIVAIAGFVMAIGLVMLGLARRRPTESGAAR